MTQIGNVYGQALYALVKEEGISSAVLEDLKVLRDCFEKEPKFLQLLAVPDLSKEERCQIIEESFRGRVHGYVLNFLKILTEKGYIRHFGACCDSFTVQYNQDEGILPVKVVSATPLSQEQTDRLIAKLSGLTGKTIQLDKRIDSGCIAGLRLEYDGKCLDDTVAHRLESVGRLLKDTVL